MLGTIRLNVTSLSTNNYIGFIYSLVVDLGVNFGSDVKTSCNGLCSVCLSDGTCLSTCAIGQYPSGVTSNPCLNCASTCTSIGCRDTDTTCNLCLDKNCKICPDFTTKNCTLYFCTGNTFKLSTSSNCQNCDSSCSGCYNSGPTACLSCNNGFFLNGACHPFCPTGYYYGTGSCILSLSLIVNLNLLDILGIVTDSQLGFKTVAGSSTDYYPTFDVNDPLPIQNRGYYFYSQTYLQFPPNSIDSRLLTFGNAFTFAF